MMAQPDVEGLIRKTRQYEFSDGLRDFQLAILFAFGGGTVWLSLEPFWLDWVFSLAQRFGRWAAWFSLLPVLLMPLSVWGVLYVMKAIRQRWLWRASGMVMPARWMVSRQVNLLGAAVLVGGLGLAFGLRYLGRVDNTFVLRMLWVATGWSFSVTTIGVGRDIGLPRYIWLGVAGGILSSALLFLPLTFGQSALAFGLLWSLCLIASGTIALRRAWRALPEKRR
jgi:hypothetical protein